MTDFTETFRRTTYPKIAPAANLQAGKTVLVTGSSEGIGYNIAAAFAEAQAATVILVSRTQSKLNIAVASLAKRFPQTNILAQACDVSSIDQAQKLWPSLVQADIGFVDVLVLNAGATDQPTTTEETISSLQFAIGSNIVLVEAFRAQPNFDRRHRCLVNISSAGFLCYPGIRQQTIYHAGKAGFAAYMAHATETVSESEMRLVSLHPGCVFSSAAEKAAAGNEQVRNLPIWDDPSLSAHMAAWLAGPEADWLHGRFVWANWDVDELLQMKAEITQNPAMLKVGIIGTDAFSFPQLMQRCAESPLPQSWHD